MTQYFKKSSSLTFQCQLSSSWSLALTKVEHLASLTDSLIAITPEALPSAPFIAISPVSANIDTIAPLHSKLEGLKHKLSKQHKSGNFSAPSTASAVQTLGLYQPWFGKGATKMQKKPCSMSGNAFPTHWWKPMDWEITVTFFSSLTASLAYATWLTLVL